MKRLAGTIIAIAALTGCAHPATHGVVRSRNYVPAHDETTMIATGNGSFVMSTDHYDEKWEIHFVGVDSDNEMREFVTEVSRDVHARCQVGSKFVDADTDHPDCPPS